MTTNHTDLIRRLRGACLDYEMGTRLSELVDEAADALEAMQSETARLVDKSNAYIVDNARLADALEAMQTWRDTVDDMLVTCGWVASDDPRESINRLINWHVSVALDPSVSSEAYMLIDQKARQKIEELTAQLDELAEAYNTLVSRWNNQ